MYIFALKIDPEGQWTVWKSNSASDAEEIRLMEVFTELLKDDSHSVRLHVATHIEW